MEVETNNFILMSRIIIPRALVGKDLIAEVNLGLKDVLN